VRINRTTERLDGAFALRELPRLILAPCRAQLSGVLWLEADDGTRRIVYSRGWPISATSTSADEQIEAHLLDSGQLSAAQLRKAITQANSKKQELQQALADLSLLSKTTFVALLLELRKKIVTNALGRPCQARFEESPTAPVGFSYLPLIECAAVAVTSWPSAEQQAALQAAGADPLSVHGSDAELAMMLGATPPMLALMQTLTRQSMTIAELVTVAGSSRADLVAALTARLIQPPRDIAPVDEHFDADLSDALRIVQEKARGAWEPVVIKAVEHKGPSKASIVAALLATAVVSILLTWLAVGRVMPKEEPALIAEIPPEPPDAVEPSASQPSVLAAQAEKSFEQRMAEKAKVKLSAEERARVDALFKRGNALAKKKKWDAAAKEYRAALELDPTSAQAHRALAIACTHSGDLDQAIFEYKIYLRLAPAAADRDSVEDLIEAYENRAGR
jgi:tetratricopeptide (TPR) repeat protein